MNTWCYENAHALMGEALVEASQAKAIGEVPVGAIAVWNSEIIARAHNIVETQQDATSHAEMLVLKLASARCARWRLNDVSLFVTLEPCPMCMGALVLARVKELFFGSSDPHLGAAGSLFSLANCKGIPPTLKVFSGIRENECSQILRSYFQSIRRGDREVEGA